MDIKVSSILTIPLYISRVDNFEEINKALLPEIKKHREENKSLPMSNDKCWRGMRQYNSEKPLLESIDILCSRFHSDFMKDKKETDRRTVYWTNVNEKGGRNMFHHHAMGTNGQSTELSGVYYVQGKGTGKIIFRTHYHMENQISPYMPYSMSPSYEPNDGDILMFPSYLLHEIEPNPSEEQRITIAFNVSLFLGSEWAKKTIMNKVKDDNPKS